MVDIKNNAIKSLMQFEIFLLKSEYEEELRISASNLSLSLNANGKTMIKNNVICYIS